MRFSEERTTSMGCYKNIGDIFDTSNRPFVIAEIAQTHDGSLGTAHAYIDAVADAGASAIKFQTHIAQYESTLLEPWRVIFSYQDASRYDYWKRMEFTEEQWTGLKAHAEDKGLTFMSSPFSLESAQMLDRIGMALWKIPSGEITNYHMLDFIFATRKPVILSSGMSNFSELDEVVERARLSKLDFAVMQCTSTYPNTPKETGLNLIREFRERYGCLSGLSDHSGTIYPALSAMTLGASFVEIHVCFDSREFGPDISSSVTIEDLKAICAGSHYIHEMISNPIDKSTISEQLSATKAIFYKGLYAKRLLEPGTTLTLEDISAKKPYQGIPASNYAAVVGRRLRHHINKDEAIRLEDLE